MPLSLARFVDRLRRFGVLPPLRSCRVCGCTEEDCRGCIARTGRPCYWVEEDLCSACAPPAPIPVHIDVADRTTAEEIDRRTERARAMMHDRLPPRL